KFVAAHARHVVIFAATVFQCLGKKTQDAVSFQVSETVVDLLEPVHIRDHHSQRRVFAFAARQFPLKLQEQRPRIGQSREIVGGRRIFRLLIFKSILDRQRHLAAHRQQNAQVVGGEGVAFGAIQGEHSNHARHAFERNRQGRTQSAEFAGIVQISRLDGRIPVDDWLFVLRHPSREPLPQGNAQRIEQAVVIAVDILRHPFVVALHINRDGVVGNHRLGLHGKTRQRLTQSERRAHILAQLEQRLSFLPRRRNRRKKGRLLANVLRRGSIFEPGGGSFSALDFDGGRERCIHLLRRFGYRQPFQVLVALLQNRNYLWIERLP